MVELKEGIILSKKAPKEPISFSYEKGTINYIPYEEIYKFNFLKLKDQALDKGELFIDGIKIYPDENNESSLFVLAVNSLIKVTLCFVTTKKEKKEKVQFVQSELIKLRELPTNTDDEKNAKIAAIFETIAALSPSYVLVDLNDEGNENSVTLSRLFDKYYQELLLIVLQERPLEQPEVIDEEPEVVSLNIGTNSQVTVSKEKQKKQSKLVKSKSGSPFGKVLKESIKGNVMIYLSFVIPTIGVVAFSLLSPLYAQISNKILLIPFIITIVVCFFLYMLMTYKCSDFEDKDHKFAYMIINTVTTLIGYGLGFVIYILFKLFDSDIKDSGSNVLGIILSIVLALILITSVLYLKPVGDKIKSLFKKKK